MTCTVPSIFGFQKWFDARFKDLCQAHDDAYVTGSVKDKFAADFIISKRFAQRGYKVLAISCFFYVTTLGTIYWCWKRWL